MKDPIEFSDYPKIFFSTFWTKYLKFLYAQYFPTLNQFPPKPPIFLPHFKSIPSQTPKFSPIFPDFPDKTSQIPKFPQIEKTVAFTANSLIFQPKTTISDKQTDRQTD